MGGNMISWNWPNWITVVLMVAAGYLVVSLATQLVRSRLGMKSSTPRGPTGVTGAGQDKTAQNFAGVYGASMFALPQPAGAWG